MLLNDVSENNYLMKQDKEETETEAMNVCRKTKIKVVGRNPVGNLVIFSVLLFKDCMQYLLQVVIWHAFQVTCISIEYHLIVQIPKSFTFGWFPPTWLLVIRLK